MVIRSLEGAIARKQFELRKFRFAECYWDRAKREVGIRLTNDKNERGILTIQQKRGEYAKIYCQSFLDHCGIVHKEGSRIYTAVMDEVRKMIILKLD